MARYKCIKELILDKYDKDGFSCENESTLIEVGQTFEAVNLPYNIIAGADAVHLENENMWCELYQDTLSEYFDELQERSGENG